MSYTTKIALITFGGDGSDNPVPLTREDYYLTDEQQRFEYINMFVVVPYEGTTKSVTGLIQLDPKTGLPKLGPNDLCVSPCPPTCNG